MCIDRGAGEALPCLDSDGVVGLFHGAARRRLESAILPGFMASQRWFAARARRLAAVEVADAAPLARARAALVLVDVDYEHGPPERYLLALATADASSGVARAAPNAALARLEGEGGRRILQDALRDLEVVRALVGLLDDREALTTQGGGRVRFVPTPAWDPTEAARLGVRKPRLRFLGEDHTNTTVAIGEDRVLKLFRRLEAGIHPEAEIGAYLAARPGFERVPRVFATLQYEDREGAATTLGLLQEYVADCDSAWDFTLKELDRFRERSRSLPAPGDHASALGSESGPLDRLAPLLRETIGGYLTVASDLGGATAELHLALSDEACAATALRAEVITAGDLVEWSRRMEAQATQSFRLLESFQADLSPADREVARRVLNRAADILTRFRSLPALYARSVRKIRCHGDYHLGQILRQRGSGRLFIIDFEGEPERPAAERSAKSSALKDVAGMLRSFSYAAHTSGLDDGSAAETRAWLRLWELGVSSRFLGSYRKVASGGALLPDDETAFRQWVDIFVLEKACYELGYEINNRPDWIRIPLAGLESLMDGA